MTNPLEENMVLRTEESIAQKRPAQALETANELSAIDPKDAIVWFIKGKAHYAADQFEDALASFSQAATIQNDRPEIWLMMGYSLIALRRYEEALPSLEYVKGVQPESIEATAALCAVHSILGHTAEGREYLEQAKKTDRPAAAKILEAFYSDYFSKSQSVEASTKAMLERMLYGLKLQ